MTGNQLIFLAYSLSQLREYVKLFNNEELNSIVSDNLHTLLTFDLLRAGFGEMRKRQSLFASNETFALRDNEFELEFDSSFRDLDKILRILN